MARRRMDRVQVDDPLRRLPARTVLPLAPDVFVGASRRTGVGASMRDVADALSGLAGSVGGLAKINEAAQKERQEAAYQDWYRKPQEERKALFNAGIAPDGTKYAENPQISAGYGADRANDLANQFEAEVLSGYDWVGTNNVDEDLFKYSAEAEKEFEGNEFGRTGFLTEMNRYRDKLMAYQAQQRQTANVQRMRDGVDATYRTVYRRMKEDGRSTDEIYAELGRVSKEMQSESAMKVGLPKDEMDDLMFSLAGQIVQEDPDLAMKIISDDRGGIGAIGFKRKNLEQSEAIANAALKVRTERAKVEVAKKISESIFLRGTLGENISTIDDWESEPLPDGTTLKLSKKEITDEVVKQYKIRSAEQARQWRETPVDTMKREITQLSKMGLKNPEWEAMFDSLPMMLTEENLQDPKKSSEIMRAVQLYLIGSKLNPQFTDAHLNEKTSRILDNVRIAQDYMGVPEIDRAVMMAMKAEDPNNPAATSMESLRQADKIIQEESGYDNGTAFARLVRQTAQGYIRMQGLPPAKAVELAVESVKKRGAEINGNFVELPRDPRTGKPSMLPEDFEELATDAMQAWYDKHGNPMEYSFDDLTLRSDPNGTFMITDKSGTPVIGVDTGSGGTAVPILTMKEMLSIREKKDHDRILGLVKKQHQDQEFTNLAREGKDAELYKELAKEYGGDPSYLQGLKIKNKIEQYRDRDRAKSLLNWLVGPVKEGKPPVRPSDRSNILPKITGKPTMAGTAPELPTPDPIKEKKALEGTPELMPPLGGVLNN